MKRKSGYYWIKFKGEWRVAKYQTKNETYSNMWFVFGYNLISNDEVFELINEERILPPNN